MLQAVSLDVYKRQAHRYADLAKKQADECQDPKRREELMKMAESCSRVPEFPAVTFIAVSYTHLKQLYAPTHPI